jgi:flagellar biosynthetic protein FlhB
MAENDDQERTEQPSQKRLREAREKGDVPRSRDLSGALVVLAGVAALLSGSERAMDHARTIYRLGLGYGREALFSDALPARVLGMAVREALMLFAPVAVATLLAVFAAPVLVGGIHFSGQALQPKFDRLDPVAGLGRIFAVRGLVELGKALLKLLFIGSALAMLLKHSVDELQALGRADVALGVARAMSLLGRSALLFGALLALIGGADALYQKFDHARRLRMTRQEIREEYKQSEGRPEVKARIRRVQQEMAQRRMMEKLPTADVIVTNPTQFAVALRYGKDVAAPRVVAKGADLVAAAIRDRAREHRIPILSAPPLARALYRSCALDDEIPGNLYAAVAQVLSYVYQLRTWTQGPAPKEPVVGDVPGGEPD